MHALTTIYCQPKNCAKSKAGCDWTELGIGATGDNGDISWCCTDDAIAEGLCDYSEPAYGRMIVNRTLFKGHHRTIRVFDAPNQEKYIKNGMMELKDGMNEDDDASGMYVLIMANCLTTGREVYVEGEYSWKSKHGYLPGDLFDEMYFFAFLVIFNSILVVLYGSAMKKYEDAQIPIQKWIFAAMVIGFLETCTKYFNYRIWNSDGKQHWFPLYLGLMVGVSKRAFSRVLVVMVSLGWGVIRDDLGDQMRKIILLGGTYAGFSVARDIVAVVQVIENEKMSVHFEDELFDALTILTFVVAAVDVSFYMWILDSLNSTMQYLESMNQNMKLLRYLRLRLVLLISILFAIAWAVFGIVDNLMEEGMLPLQSAWTLSGVWELNYLFVLISVAVLWRPNESAKNYAYVMELPSLGGDVEFCTNDGLEEDDDELVTSAIDDVETADEKDPPLKVDGGVGA
uniref:GOST seven transmembrane domain-containing protein n=1 Tax=Proboscia inermis TaxID=420281 RepID=A0A7S0GMJ3_9STRA|mmetsp:Transcript_605/g.654  ORF Transcript_605/g.654 Transcript_605/m.654 type:complete len:455 (+) Transcript_605:504-1868(+)